MPTASTPSMPHGDEFGDALPVGSAAASRVQRRAYLAAILAIVVVALAATLLVLDQRRQVTQALTSSTQNLASSLEQTMDGMIDTVDIALQSSADEIFHLRTGHRLPSDEVTAYLTRQAQRLPLVAYMRATDETGRVLYGPGVPASAVSLADREFFQHLRATPNAGLYVAKPLIGRIAQRWLWTFSRRIERPDGSFAGTVYASIYTDELDKFLAQIELAPGSSLALRDKDLGLIARKTFANDNPIPVGSSKLSDRFAAAFHMNPNEGTYISDHTSLDPLRRLYSYRKSAKYGYLVNVGTSYDAAFAAWRTQAALVAGLVLVFSALMLALARLTSRASLRQSTLIQSLRDSAASLARQHQALVSLEAQQRSLLESLDTGIVVHAPDSAIIFSNRRAAALLGWSEAQMQGKQALDPAWCFVDEHHRALTPDQYPVSRVLLSGQAVHQILLGVKAPGREDITWLLGGAFPEHHDDGRLKQVVVNFHDVSEQQRDREALEEHKNHLSKLVEARTEQLLQAKDAAEDANRAKSSFLANMSHELRTPLTAIIGMTHLALRRTSDPKLIDHLNKSAKASQHLLALINNVLDLSKIESGRMTLDARDFCLADLLGDAVRLSSESAQDKGLSLEIVIDPDIPAHLCGDPLRIQQLIINFIGNAIKFSERGGIVIDARLSAPLVAGAPEVGLRVSVSDQGIGLDEAALASLFQPFTQADVSATRRFGGTGLGLAICRRLAGLMDGEVGASSTPGVGSTFWAEFRVRQISAALESVSATEPASRYETALSENFAGRRVLLVEDDDMTREVVSELLSTAGLLADEALHGAQAVELARATDYDLILMDMQMPVMNGVDATRAIRQLPGKATVPILALTANAFAEDRQRCFDAGMNDHIAKPLTAESLYKALYHALLQHQ